MEHSIKSVTFGGFDKQDVIRYIETAAAAQKALEEEIAVLRQQVSSLTEEVGSLQAQSKSLLSERDQLAKALEQETASRQELEALKPLESEVASLRPDAAAYAQFRERIGAIECEARKRASDLELATVAQLQQTVNLFREQYQILMRNFETTANHVNSELRKVEVNLTQLPRTMDQPGNDLNELSARLEQIKSDLQG